MVPCGTFLKRVLAPKKVLLLSQASVHNNIRNFLVLHRTIFKKIPYRTICRTLQSEEHFHDAKNPLIMQKVSSSVRRTLFFNKEPLKNRLFKSVDVHEHRLKCAPAL